MSLRDRKKAATRQRIADAAARLFAAHGYDSVAMIDVARAAEVSEQTLYNYFPTKPELVLDRAAQFRDWYQSAVEQRGSASPSAALEPLLEADIERYRDTDLDEARGEFLAQSVASTVLRRFTLEERERQVHVIAAAIDVTAPEVPMVVAQAHAASIVAAIQYLHDQIGHHVIDQSPRAAAVAQLHEVRRTVFASLDRSFERLT